MDGLFGEIECRSKPDSIVMRLVRSAMDNAHENVQSKDGPIEFLHERSKFYELAAILVDGGLNIVEEEEDILETSRQKMLSDLTEIKEWLQRRIEEMRNLIIEKDKELIERVENELNLTHALELNEKEFVYLRSKLATEKTKIEDSPDFSQSSQEFEDEDQGGDIGELKNSVDQQVSNIKQKLEDERKSLTRRIRGRSFDGEFYPPKPLNERRLSGSLLMEYELFRDNQFSGIKPLSSNSLYPGKNNLMIRQMSSDIDILKGTLDLAFGRMQSSEMFPLEKQWRWSIEKDTLMVAIKGFISDISQNSAAEFKKRNFSFPVGFSREKWTELVDGARDLHDELMALRSQIKSEEKRSNVHELSGHPASVQRTTSEPLPKVFSKLPECESDPSGSHYVAKMVKNHESFIQKQCPRVEWNWLAREGLGRDGSSSVKRDNDPNELESRIQKAIMKLDNLIKWDVDMEDDNNFCDNTTALEANTTKIDRADMSDEIRELKQEKDDLNLQILIIEEIYLLLFEGYAKNLDLELFNDNNESLIHCDSCSLPMNDVEDDDGVKTDDFQNGKVHGFEEETEILQHYLESTIKEDVHAIYFHETILKWNAKMECKDDDWIVTEEILNIVFGESMKCIEHTSISIISQLQVEIKGFETLMADLPCCSMLQETIGSLVKEDVYAVYFRELFNGWTTEVDACYIELLIKEEIYQFVILEMVKESYVTIRPSRTSDEIKCCDDFPSRTKSDFPQKENLVEKTPPFDYVEQYDEEAVNEGMEVLSDDDQRTFSAVSEKLETSIDRLLKSKASVLETDSDSDTAVEDQKSDDHQAQIHSMEEVQSERQHSCFQPEENEFLQLNPSLFSSLMGIQQLLMDFEHMIHKPLEVNCWRMEELKHQINALAQPAASMRKKKLVYKRAFITRCTNLRLAETEVDLLGNQVDRLLCLLQNIYLILRQNSTVLSQYFGVFDMLKLIKQEIAEGAGYISNIDT